jgi:hypothetical protein
MGDFESARRYATHGVQVWRSGTVDESPVEEVHAPVVACLCHRGLCEWHLGETRSCHATMMESVSLAKELNDMPALAYALCFASNLGHMEGDPAKVERLASDAVELSMRHHFAHWLALGTVYHGWARSASSATAEGLARIGDGIRDYRATGAILDMPLLIALKSEALQLADRTSDALEAITEVEAVIEKFENRYWCAELHRLRGVFLAAMGAEETQIEASFQAAISTARQQKSVSLQKRAEATYAEYCRQKASTSGGRGFRLPLW